MLFQNNISLKPYLTFGIEATAENFFSFTSIQDLQQIFAQNITQPIYILGGGSNILCTSATIQGLVLHNQLLGIEIIDQSPEQINIKVAGGQSWHSFVEYCVAHNYQGVENLSLIPGTVGAAPMQNIGAYGVEVKDIITKVEAFNMATREIETFTNQECQFGYRESIFKTTHKNKYIITAVYFCLQKIPKYNTSYGAISEYLGTTPPTCQSISQAVIAIRQSKLPDPAQIGNAGSFFKNPSIPNEQYKTLLAQYPEMPGYPAPTLLTKVPAGWLIEQCGWKGYRLADAGVHINQALVLVNYGQALGQDIYNLSSEIVSSVHQKFNITLEREVNIW